MKCIKCKTKNINSANYCKKCGYHFSENEQKIAKRWTLVGFLELFDKIKNRINLSFITNHILFKIGSIIIVLVMGIAIWIGNGNDIKILDSDIYKIQYNKKLEEYYLISQNKSTKLNLFIPNRINKLSILHYNENNELLETEKIGKDKEIILNINDSDDYYILEAKYSKNQLDKIKLYVYLEEDVEVYNEK